MVNYVARKIVLIGVIGLFAVIIYYILAPNISIFKNDTLGKRIAIEISSSDRRSLDVAVGTTTLSIDFAVTEDEKARGLGGKVSLDDNKGLLFVFDNSGYPAIWMKNMLFPIDIAWIDQNFHIVDMKKNVSPNTYPSSFEPSPGAEAKYVLEVNAGFFDTHNISIGNTLTIPDNDHYSI